MNQLKLISTKQSTQDKLFSLGLLSPAILITTIFILVPVVDSVIRSFMDYKVRNIISGRPGTWNNFENYIKLFTNDKLMPSIWTTFMFVFGVVIVQLVLGFALALILDYTKRGARFLRSIMMTPWVVPTMISGLMWMWVFQPQYGFLKYLVGLLSGGQITDFAILNNPKTALLGIGIAALWKQIPLMTLLLLAGLQNVPYDIIEASTIDGAGAIRRFFHIIIPYMTSVIKVAVSMSIIENFKQFPLFWTMTGGGPDNATTTLAVLSYREAFVSSNFGSGAAVTTVWMILMMVFVFAYNKLLKPQVMD